MDSTLVQSVLWIAAGALLVLYLKRRRSRKVVS
jgi:hypothetical protein